MLFPELKKKFRTRSSYILLAQGQSLFVLVIYLLDYLPGPFCKWACKVTCKAQDLFLGPMFIYTGEQQKRKPHNFFFLKRATKSLIPGFLRKAKIRRLDPCHFCEGGSWGDIPMPSLLCTSPARNKIFWPVGLVLYLKGLLITFSLTCHATM